MLKMKKPTSDSRLQKLKFLLSRQLQNQRSASVKPTCCAAPFQPGLQLSAHLPKIKQAI